MNRLAIGVVLLVVGVLLVVWIGNGPLFSGIESKGLASEITEWVKLAVAFVTLLIGIVNLRLALRKKDS